MIKFKDPKDMKLFFMLHPLLQVILTDGSWWAYQRGLDYVITDTISSQEEDRRLKRRSTSHSQKRAADLRSRDWSYQDKQQFKEYLEGKYGAYGALSHAGKIRLVVLHDSGHGEHFHIQLHSKFRL